jgi:hypothetical protein
MENFLFIGGRQDGLNIPLGDDVEFVQMADGAKGRDTYIRDTLVIGIDTSITFYRHEKLTPEEVLDLLAKHYKAWCLNRSGGPR